MAAEHSFSFFFNGEFDSSIALDKLKAYGAVFIISVNIEDKDAYTRCKGYVQFLFPRNAESLDETFEGLTFVHSVNDPAAYAPFYSYKYICVHGYPRPNLKLKKRLENSKAAIEKIQFKRFVNRVGANLLENILQ